MRNLPWKGFTITSACIVSTLLLQFYFSPSEFVAVRGILMILAMKISSLAFDKGPSARLADLGTFLAYLFNPATLIFGPFHTFSDFEKTLCRRSLKEELSFCVSGIALIFIALCLLIYSSCVTLIVPSESVFADYFTAQSFRTSHYFVSFLSQGLLSLSGMHLSTCSPTSVEFPRSLVDVVVAWNIPMHRYLHSYIYQNLIVFGPATCVFAAFAVSSLLHGFNFQISAVLLSLGFVCFFENKIRNRLSNRFSMCVRARPCKNCQHKRGWNSWQTMLVNVLFFVHAVYQLIYLGAPFDDQGASEGCMTETVESLVEIETALSRLSKELDQFEGTWAGNISKLLASAELYDRELLSDDASPEMSVTAQMLLEELGTKGEETLTQMLAHHKSLHHSVSQIGKDIDKSTHKEIGGLIRNEKDIERDPKSQRLVDGMVCDYLMTCGHTSIAEILVKEAGLGGRIDGYLANRKVIDWIMEALKSQDIGPAIAWLKQNPHIDAKLQYDLLKQHMVALIQEGRRIEAMQFGRQLSPFGYEQETAQIMGAIVMGRDRNDPRYEALFSPLAWPALESRMSVALAQSDTRFGNVILTGMRAVPILVNLKQVMVNRQDHLFSGEELPVEVKIDEYVHSTFTCPILRQQSTDSNPPMRLTCGHVISREAVSKLCSNHRNNRLKCPYCPEESHQNDAKQGFLCMSVSSVSFNTDVNVRYERLSTEYAKLRSHVKVLSEGVFSERRKNEAFNERILELERQLHKVNTENESLTFRNDQLVKRVESLQDELETLSHSRGGSLKKGKFPKKSKDTKELLSELGTLGERVLVLEEELQNKIQQNAELTRKMSELEEKHAEELSLLSTDFTRKLEEAESHKFDPDRRREHKPERPVKSVKPLEQCIELQFSNILAESPSPPPPPINEAYLQVAESTRNLLQGLSTLFELLYQRTQVYPFDATLETLPNHVKKLSSELVQCSQLFSSPIEIVQRCIQKAEFQWSTDVAELHSALKVIVRHCKVMMPELLKRLAAEENKVTWCDSQLEKLNNTWCADLCHLLAALDSVSSVLANTSSTDGNEGEKLCAALEEGVGVVKELETTFAARWTIESRFPTATKRICCIGTATSHCLSRLVNEAGKLSARVHAINGLFLENGKDNVASPGDVLGKHGYNPFDECEEAVEESSVEEVSNCTIGVDTSDLVQASAVVSENVNNSPASSTSSKNENTSIQLMVDCLKSRVCALESERESHLVDLSLLRRKLENLGMKEAGDDRQSELEMLKQVNRERLREVTDNLQIAQCATNYYKGECEILLRKYFLCVEEKRVLEETVRDMRRELSSLTDELASVRRGYDSQLSQMTEHVAELNGKLACIEKERSEQKTPVTPQRSGLKSLFLK
ncbi:hypothetical protein RB195_016220 [Necator americanus]